MRRRDSLGAAVAVLLPALALSAEAEALDEEFLEYLAEFEEDDDWNWFAQDDEDKKTAAKPAPAKKPDPSPEKVKP